MNTLNAKWDRRATPGVVHFYAAQRLIGFLGGIAFVALIVLGVWGLSRWEQAARARKSAAPGTSSVPRDHASNATPPVPTFVTAGFVSLPSPEPQAEEEPKPKPKQATTEDPSLVSPPPAKQAPRADRSEDATREVLQPAQVEPSLLLRRILAPRDAMVKAVQVQPGQIVKKGDLLLILSSETLDWQMIELRGHLETAEAKLAVVNQKLANVQRLGQNNATPQQQFLELQAEVEISRVELKTRKSQYELLTRAQMQLNVLAPVDGRVHAENLDANLLGNPVNRGDLLLEIIAINENRPAQ